MPLDDTPCITPGTLPRDSDRSGITNLPLRTVTISSCTDAELPLISDSSALYILDRETPICLRMRASPGLALSSISPLGRILPPIDASRLRRSGNRVVILYRFGKLADASVDRSCPLKSTPT